jgi:DNA mismatch endonuclease (patch repair protein)
MPKVNTSWWEAKLAATRARDLRNNAALEKAGWIVVRIWEHENPIDAADRVEEAIRHEHGNGAPAPGSAHPPRS